MLKHIALWKFKAEAEGKTAAENIAIVQTRLEGLYGKIPEIKSIQVRANTFPYPGNYDAIMIGEFESEKTLKAYQANPLHEEVAGYIRKVTETRASVDYEE